MSDDDEDTWRKLRPKSPRDSERVSSVDIKRMTDSQRQRLVDQGTSMVDPIKLDDWSSPIDLYERAPNDAEAEIVKRLRRDSDVQKLMEYVGKLAHRIDKQRQDERSGNEARANQLLELLNRPPNEVTVKLRSEVVALRGEISSLRGEITELHESNNSLHREVDATKRFRKASLWALGLVATVALGGLGTAIKGLYDRGYGEGADAVRIQQLERQYDRFERQYDRDRRQDVFPSPSTK